MQGLIESAYLKGRRLIESVSPLSNPFPPKHSLNLITFFFFFLNITLPSLNSNNKVFV